MAAFNTNQVQSVARTMAHSFLDDPLNQFSLAGVSRAEELLYQHSLLHTRHAAQAGNLYLLDGDPKAFLVGSDSSKVSGWADALLHVRIVVKTLQMLDAKDRRRILANQRLAGKVTDLNWQREFVSGRFFRIKIVAVDKELRGTGAFRRLITPRIEFCDTHAIPMVLETHNERNVEIYRHFGFELVKTLASGCLPVRQHCMIRHPKRAS